uniref:Replication protein VP4 n=1 Tax=Gokushovirinae environmental samples TaxID=1478972 RepID=A0A2R3UAF4_9VIRU|nr:replication protein VP4 [Gokushovirinae environmental samples]
MGCDEPLIGFHSKEFGPSGKRRITFDRNSAFSGIPIPLPCQRCMGCRMKYTRDWAIRCMHEKQMHEVSTFLTLTYDNEHLPECGTLVRKHPAAFLKRLRDAVSPRRFRFYGCGEYGEKTFRPHYHLLLFGMEFNDKKYYKMADGGQKLYTSKFVEKYWTCGYNVLGDVDFDSCAYVAGYITKKITGDKAADHYMRVTSDGELMQLLPEFSMMSRMPGVGSTWFEKYGAHAYQFDSVIMKGREVSPPRFYDSRYEVVDSDHFALLKSLRRRKSVLRKADNTSARRHVKEDLLRLNLKANQREF